MEGVEVLLGPTLHVIKLLMTTVSSKFVRDNEAILEDVIQTIPVLTAL